MHHRLLNFRCVGRLHLNLNAIQFALQVLLRGRIHHLLLDARGVRDPREENHLALVAVILGLELVVKEPVSWAVFWKRIDETVVISLYTRRRIIVERQR